MTLSDFGLTGLAVMGQNLARNIARNGFAISVHNRTASKTDEFMEQFGTEGTFIPSHSLKDFVLSIRPPRPVMIMVKAGDPVDAVISELVPLLEPGDIIIDGGNSFYTDTQRREKALKERGLRFIGAGVSGGEEGALNGPSIMPGGDPTAYARIAPIFNKIAANVGGIPCCAHIGADGAGHYVKMVHNGIEYADMQLIAEAYDILRSVLSLSAGQIADVFREWNEGDLDSFLIQITADVLCKVDDETGKPLVDLIVDSAAQKGTGKWTCQEALDLGIPATTITEAVFARSMSALRSERIHASTVLKGPQDANYAGSPKELIDAVRDALYASKICCYAQGFQLLDAAANENHWKLNRGQIATIWRGGCIIRAQFLNRIKDAYDDDAKLPNLLLASYFTNALDQRQKSWRKVIGIAAELGIPVPAFSSALAYYDSYRRDRLPANLLQGLRDYFGAHTYQRIDEEGDFHTQWGE